MRRLSIGAALSALFLALLPAASAGPTAGGYASDRVEYVQFVPFEVGSATGAKVVGKYLYVTSWKNFSIYDVSDPENPALLSTTPFGFKFENEDVATNGEILLFAESIPGTPSPSGRKGVLHIFNVEDKENPVKAAELQWQPNHTADCLLKCTWAYGSSGDIVDLRDPEKPELMEGNWKVMTMGANPDGVHDVTEFKNGFILTSPYSSPLQIVDVRDPLAPEVIATGRHPDPENWIFHSGRWPNEGRDRILLMQGEQNAVTRCEMQPTGPFVTYVTTSWEKTETVVQADTYRVENGTYQDGGPPANGLGCSAHWFTEHPDFHNGGLVAIGYYEHGTRFLDVSSDGKIKEVGWFVPWGGSTSAAYWMTKELVYAVDYSRGIDILRFTRKGS